LLIVEVSAQQGELKGATLTYCYTNLSEMGYIRYFLDATIAFLPMAVSFF